MSNTTIAAEDPSLASALRTLPDENPLLAEVKEALLMASQKPKDEAFLFLQMRLEPSVIVNDEVCTHRSVYRAIFDILRALGIEIEMAVGISIVETVIDALFSVTDYKDVNKKAKDLLKTHVKGMASGQSSLSHRTSPSTINGNSMQDVRSASYTEPGQNGYRNDSDRKISSVANIFRDSSRCFSGTFESALSFHRFRKLFEGTCNQFGVSSASRVSLLSNALTGIALDHYLEFIQGKVESINEAFEVLEKRFDSQYARAQAQSYLESQTIASIREEKDCSTISALEYAQRRINNVIPMCGPAFIDESHKGRFLAHMLRFESWAQPCLAMRMTQAQGYSTFVAALHSALTQQTLSGQGEKLGTSKPNANLMAHTNWFGQQYANPTYKRRYPHHSERPRRSREQLAKLKARTRCLKCNQLGHWRAECPNKQLSISDAIESRMKRTGGSPSSMRTALIALAVDEDEHNAYTEDCALLDNAETNDLHERLADDPFEALLTTLDIAEDSKPSPLSIHLVTTHVSSNFHINNQAEPAPIIPQPSLDSACIQNSTVNNIMVMPMNTPNLVTCYAVDNGQQFKGALIDTGAQKSVMGSGQAAAYLKFSQEQPRFHRTLQRYRFGSTTLLAQQAMWVTIPTPGRIIREPIDIVPCEIPFLLGLDLLEKYGLQPLVLEKQLQGLHGGWKIDLTSKDGHLYYRWDPPQGTYTSHARSRDPRIELGNITEPAIKPTQVTNRNHPKPSETKEVAEQNLFTKQELQRIHRHFAHPSATKLYAILQRSMKTTPPNTLAELQSIVDSCAVCQEYAPRQVTFRVRAADKVVFNHRIILDLTWLPARNPPHPRQNRPALHIVDAGTHFNAASFLSGESTIDIWNTFVRIWATMYIGMPSSMLVDQGSAFLSDEWKFGCEVNGIEITATGTESHNSLASGETYHAYLRRIYSKLQREFPRITDDINLALAVKAVNDCTGPRGLCPTLLVFGTLPQFPSPSKRDHNSQTERHRAASLARSEYERIVSMARLQLAAKKPVAPAERPQYQPGDLVYVYREKERAYTGPHMVASAHGKQVRLHVGDRNGPKSFNKAQVRPAPLPNAFKSGQTEPRYPLQVLHTEILSAGDAREGLFSEEKRKELLGLLERGVFKIVLREEAGDRPNIVPSRYVLAIKHSEKPDESPRLKARFVLGGHVDKDRNRIVHDTRTVRPESTRMLIALATIFGMKISLADWRQGYTQSKSPLLRKVFVRPNELQLNENELVQVLRPVYGLADAGEYWSDTLSNHLREHCKFEQATTDLALWLKTTASKLVALAVTYVDDVLLAATDDALSEFERISRKRFDISLDTANTLSYLGMRIVTSPDGTRRISQPKQISRLKSLPLNSTFESYRSARASLAWLAQTRPDVCCAISVAARVTLDKFSPDAIRAHNSTVNYLQRTRDIELVFPKLEEESLRIAVYVDAGYQDSDSGYSQIGYVIFLADKSNSSAFLLYSSKNHVAW